MKVRKETLVEMTDREVVERYNKLMRYLDRKGFPYTWEKAGHITVPITNLKRVLEKGGEKA